MHTTGWRQIPPFTQIIARDGLAYTLLAVTPCGTCATLLDAKRQIVAYPIGSGEVAVIAIPDLSDALVTIARVFTIEGMSVSS